MEDQFKKMGKDLMASRSWVTWVVAAVVCLVAAFLRPLLFLLAAGFLLRALWLAWPTIKKQMNL